MRPRDTGELVLLAAIWAASFLFVRICAPAFGALPLAGLRVMGAAAVLLPLIAWQGGWAAMGRHWRAILLVGIVNSALPFACYAYAALTVSAGLSAIFNAAAPLFGAAIAWAWLNDKLSASRIAGLAIGFAGVFGLAWNKAGFQADAGGLGTTLAVGACLLASLSYGFAANYTRKYLHAVPPLVVAAGSQLGASLVLVAPTVLLWPAEAPDAAAWVNLSLLAVVCTGFAYLLYFRLIAHVGPANAIAVTFLIPAFAVAWGALLLDETLTPAMVAGCAVILLGTALATGLVQRQRWFGARSAP